MSYFERQLHEGRLRNLQQRLGLIKTRIYLDWANVVFNLFNALTWLYPRERAWAGYFVGAFLYGSYYWVLKLVEDHEKVSALRTEYVTLKMEGAIDGL